MILVIPEHFLTSFKILGLRGFHEKMHRASFMAFQSLGIHFVHVGSFVILILWVLMKPHDCLLLIVIPPDAVDPYLGS